MRHANIPVFIPHLGCPNQCVFCNQRSISGVDEFKPESVREIIDNALLTIAPDTEVEIAFFGGSFTGIDRDLMISLLEVANTYIRVRHSVQILDHAFGFDIPKTIMALPPPLYSVHFSRLDMPMP